MDIKFFHIVETTWMISLWPLVWMSCLNLKKFIWGFVEDKISLWQCDGVLIAQYYTITCLSVDMIWCEVAW